MHPPTLSGPPFHDDALPFVTTNTAGLLLILQILLAGIVSATRGPIAVGDGGKDTLVRAIRRHGNLAENAGIFVAGFTLLELSASASSLLIGLCAVFVAVRLIHALGLSQANTSNAMRVIGAVGTYLCGLMLGGTLLWIGVDAGMSAPGGQ